MKNYQKSLLIASLLSCTALTSTVALANQATEYDLGTLVVTAARTEQKGFDVNADVTVVDNKKLSSMHYSNLGEALKDVPGVTLQNYGISGENYTSNRLYINGSSNIIILVDGMRRNVNGSTSNSLSPSEYPDLDNVEKIEVLKGAAGVLYGSDAQGGVINIITKKNKQLGTKTTLRSTYGSFSHRTFNFVTRTTDENSYWSASYLKNLAGDFYDGHGNRIIHKVDSSNLSVQIGGKLANGDQLVFDGTMYKSNYTRPSGGGVNTKTYNKGRKNNSRLSLQWTHNLSDNLTNNFSIFQNNNMLEDSYFSTAGSSPWNMTLKTRGFSDQLTYTDELNTLTTGIDVYQDIVEKYEASGAAFNDKTLTNKAFFIQDMINIAPNWTLTPGIRYTQTSKFGNNTAKSLALGYNDGNTNIYLSYNDFFIAPKHGHLYSKKSGNPDLIPTVGKTIQLGIKHQIDDSLLISSTIYKTTATNVIEYDRVQLKYRNIANEKINGWNIGFNKTFNENLSLNATYTGIYMPAENSQKRVNRDGYIPKGELTIGLNYEKSKFSALISAHGIFDRPGKMYVSRTPKATPANPKPKAQNVLSEIPSSLSTFWLFNATFNYSPNRDIQTYLKINNLFDKFYTDQLYDPHPETTGWYSAPGRNYEVGVSLSF